MKILSLKARHDATLAYLEDGKLVFSIEAEKNSNARNATPNEALFYAAMTKLSSPPDVIAFSGWKESSSKLAEYQGTGPETLIQFPIKSFGHKAAYFSSSHERSHIFGSFAMLELQHGEPFYFLCYEGYLNLVGVVSDRIFDRFYQSAKPPHAIFPTGAERRIARRDTCRWFRKGSDVEPEPVP